MDGILLSNEVIARMKKQKKGGGLLKLDFRKAYDSIKWAFLEDVMKITDFGEKWIMAYVSGASTPILVNGSP